jgi:hypothetical protein
MESWRGQRGNVGPGCLVAIVVLFLVTLIALRVIPKMVAVGEFQNEVVRLADRANRRDYPDKRILKGLRDKGEELRLPINPKDIKVKRTSSHLEINVTYTIDVDLLVYTYKWHKVHDEVRPLF